MPSLKAFGRRWHTASDTLPLLGAFLGTYHIAWVVAYQLSAADLDTSGFRSDACGQKPIFSTCYIGVFTIFGVAAIAEFSIAGIGLRGGPLEVSKRRAILPFIHLMPALWLLLLVWTILGTYIVASPNINPACWEENPCLYEQVADRCISINGTKPTNITPACATLFREFGDATECWAGWLGVGQNWTRLHETCPPAIDPYVTSGFDYVLRKYDLEVVTTVPGNLTLLEQVLLLKELNITYNPDAVSESAPWSRCLDPLCEPLLRAADDCRQIDILINLMPPQSSSPKHFFEALIYTCWATLAITGIVAYMAFNSFPELDTIESWEGTLKGMARTFCCGSLLEVEAAAGEGGSGPASKEIAKSLLALFGGIDLDPTDRLLGLYLVSEQQSRRRRNHLLRVLTEAGIQEVPNSPGLVRRTLQSITKMSQQRRRGPPAGSQTTASPQLSIDDTILPANGRASPAAAAGLHGVQLVAAGIPELQEQQMPVQQQQLGNGFASSNSPAVQQLPQIAEDSFTLRPSPFSQPSMTAQSPQSTLQADLEAPPGSPPTSHAAAISATAMVRPSPYSQGAILTLPPSPYSQGAAIAPSPHSQGAGPAADSPVQRTGSEVRRNWRQMLPVYRQTMLRLRTAAMVELRPAGGTAGGTGGTYSRGSRTAGGMDRTANQAFGGMTDDSDSGSGASSPTACGVRFPPGEEQAQLDSGGMPQPPPTGETDCLPTLELLRPRFSPAAPGGSGGTAVGTPTAGGTGDGTAGSTPTAAGGLGRRGGGREVGIRVAASYRPMLTPSGCISKLSIAPREAADLCSGYHDPVPKPVVEEADKIRRFAVGAYGLQSLLWAKGRPKPMCFGNMNMLLKCLGRPLRLDSKFRKNNFNAIMQITGAQPGDLLYVSYANAPGGVLPYMLMLDRASKSVVLAVRGTVSMQDLVTDLLSTSVDVAGWMPDWVCQANKAGEGMFAHMGIVSSATAILKDLEDNDLLQELCSRVGVSPDKAGLSPRRDRVSNQGSESRSSNGGKGSGGGGGINPAGKPPAGPAGSRPANGRPPAGRAGGAPSAGSIASAASSRAGAAGVPPATAALLRQGGLAERLMSWHEAHYSQQLPSMGSMAPHRQSQAASEDAGEAEEDVGGEVVHGFGQETRVEVLPQGDAAGRMPDIGAMQPDAEVRLPLSRAKTIIRGKVQEEGWQVVVTGHSLGAAVACLLGFHLREVFPDLRCWCFNPPGGLLSWNLSVLAQPFCTSVVVGKDVISRLSFNTSRRVVDEMVLTLARCKRPKLLVLMDMLLKRWRNPGNTLCALTEISDDAVRVLEGYYRSSFLHASDQTDMYPPGRLLFLRPFKGQKKRKVVWDAVWVDAQALMGEGILLAPSMLAHHRLFVVEEALQSVLRDEAEQLPTDGKVGVV